MNAHHRVKAFVTLVAFSILNGCIPSHVWKSQPEIQKVRNTAFDAEISPCCSSAGCASFVLKVRNKTDRNLEIDWDKTLFVSKNQIRGGFNFEGIESKNRQAQRRSDVILPGCSMTTSIRPNDLKYYSSGKYGGWLQPMSSGENGVYLTVVIDGREFSEKLTVDLSPVHIN